MRGNEQVIKQLNLASSCLDDQLPARHYLTAEAGRAYGPTGGGILFGREGFARC
jgi:hypothetical protein